MAPGNTGFFVDQSLVEEVKESCASEDSSPLSPEDSWEMESLSERQSSTAAATAAVPSARQLLPRLVLERFFFHLLTCSDFQLFSAPYAPGPPDSVGTISA